MKQGIHWEQFDYQQMAREARREQEALRARLQLRRQQGPDSLDHELVWKRENCILYNMYLEQRANAMAFERRAKWRRSYGA